MDWFQIAQDDWDIYQDPTRIADYAKMGKITAAQYNQLTGLVYSPA